MRWRGHIATQRSTLLKELQTSLGTRRVAITGAPKHANYGDQAIAVATQRMAHLLGLDVVYLSHPSTHDHDDLRRELRDGTILVHGGGNFGDLWPSEHEHRLSLIRNFPNNEIVQLPQSIYWRDPSSIAETRQTMAFHGGFRLFVRDSASFRLAERSLPEVATRLVPDMTMLLEPREPPGGGGVLWLLRNDRESARQAEHQLRSFDWKDAPVSADLRRAWWTSKVTERLPTNAGTMRVRRWGFEQLARAQFRIGNGFLSTADAIVTDRLHGHLLSLLAGIPHVLLRDEFGKVENYWDTWTRDTGVVIADDIDAARVIAEEMLHA